MHSTVSSVSVIGHWTEVFSANESHKACSTSVSNLIQAPSCSGCMFLFVFRCDERGSFRIRGRSRIPCYCFFTLRLTFFCDNLTMCLSSFSSGFCDCLLLVTISALWASLLPFSICLSLLRSEFSLLPCDNKRRNYCDLLSRWRRCNNWCWCRISRY
jgi:hypothetical protein